jgi:hypothetical protein
MKESTKESIDAKVLSEEERIARKNKDAAISEDELTDIAGGGESTDAFNQSSITFKYGSKNIR